jgi:hypothetical protein
MLSLQCKDAAFNVGYHEVIGQELQQKKTLLDRQYK